MITLSQAGWGADNPPFRQLFTNLYIPGDPQADGLVQRHAAHLGFAGKCRSAAAGAGISTCATCWTGENADPGFHSRTIRPCLFRGVRNWARHPGRRFIPLDSRNHILIEAEPAWGMFVELSRDFIDAEVRWRRSSRRRQTSRRTNRRRAFCTGRWRQARLCRAGAVSPGQSAELDDPPRPDRTSPVYRHWLTECSRSRSARARRHARFRPVRADAARFNFEALVSDLGQ